MNIDELENFEQIGEGGMAAVWKAHQTTLDRTVAVKIFRTELTSNPEKMAAFMKEAKIAASLKHPNIIPLYDSIEHDGAYYFVMEYVNGRTVAEHLAEAPMTWRRTMQIAQLIAEALEYAHKSSNLIHRNIKPANIIVSDDFVPKLADLGLTTYMDNKYLAEQIQIRQLEFAPNYMSPEQCRCKTTLECKTDMYSLGATMYHMITGQIPFHEYEPMQVLEMHISGNLPNPRDVQPSTPLGVALIISRLMMKDPNDRYPTWTDVIKDIKKALGGRGLSAAPGKSSPNSTVSPATKKALATQPTDNDSALSQPVVVPIWVRAIAWSLLSLWWAYVVIIICRLPPVMPLPPVRAEPKKAALVTSSLPVAPVKSPVAGSAVPPGNEKGENGANGASQPAQIILDVSNEELILLHTLKSKLTECIMCQNFNEAIAYIAQEKQYSHSPAFDAEIDKVEQRINAISRQGSVMETAIRKKIGQTLNVRINGTMREFTVKGVSKGIINAEINSSVGSGAVSKPASIQISQIDPLEQINLIGPADTEAKCIAIFGLSMKAKDYKMAAKAAEKCGPFAEAFKMKVDTETAVAQPQ